MAFDLQSYIKVFSPRVVEKAIQTFDRATTVVVGACWGGAVLMMGFAIYTTMATVSAKRDMAKALAVEPSLPKMTQGKVDERSAEMLVDRLHRLYPEITITLGNGQVVTVSTGDGSKFRQWLTALSYIDTVAPDYHWTLSSFCVGKCPGNELMKAVVTGERIMFEAPQR